MHLMAQLLAMYANTHYKGQFRPEQFLPSAPTSVNDEEEEQRWADTLRQMRENYAARQRPN